MSVWLMVAFFATFSAAQLLQDSMTSDGWRPIIGNNHPSSSHHQILHYRNQDSDNIIKAETLPPVPTATPSTTTTTTTTPQPPLTTINFLNHSPQTQIPSLIKVLIPKTSNKQFKHQMSWALPHGPQIPLGDTLITTSKYPAGLNMHQFLAPVTPGKRHIKPILMHSGSARDEYFVAAPSTGSIVYLNKPIKTREVVGVGLPQSAINHYSINQPHAHIEFTNRFALPHFNGAVGTSPSTSTTSENPFRSYHTFTIVPKKSEKLNGDYRHNLVPPPQYLVPHSHSHHQRQRNQIKSETVRNKHHQQHYPLLQQQPQQQQQHQQQPKQQQQYSPTHQVQVTKEKFVNFVLPPEYIDYDYHSVKTKPQASPIRAHQYEVTEKRPIWAAESTNNVPFLPTPYRPVQETLSSSQYQPSTLSVQPTSPTQLEVSTIFTRLSQQQHVPLTDYEQPQFGYSVREVSTHYPIVAAPSYGVHEDLYFNEVTTQQPGTTSTTTTTTTSRPQNGGHRGRRPGHRQRTTSTTTTTTELPTLPPHLYQQNDEYQIDDYSMESYTTTSSTTTSTQRPIRRRKPSRYHNKVKSTPEPLSVPSEVSDDYEEAAAVVRRQNGNKQRQRKPHLRVRQKVDELDEEYYSKQVRATRKSTTTQSPPPPPPPTPSTMEIISEEESGEIDQDFDEFNQKFGDFERSKERIHQQYQNHVVQPASEEEFSVEEYFPSFERSTLPTYLESITELEEPSILQETTTLTPTTTSTTTSTSTTSTTTSTTAPPPPPSSTTQKSERTRGWYGSKYDTSNRPRFSVKDYRQKLHATSTASSTTGGTTEPNLTKSINENKLKYTNRFRRPSLHFNSGGTNNEATEGDEKNTNNNNGNNETAVGGKRSKFVPKDSRVSSTANEAVTILNGKKVKAVNTRLRPFGRHKTTTVVPTATTTTTTTAPSPPKVQKKSNLFQRRRPLNSSIRMKIFNKNKNASEAAIATTTTEATHTTLEIDPNDAVANNNNKNEDDVSDESEIVTEFTSTRLSDLEIAKQFQAQQEQQQLQQKEPLLYSQRVSDLTSSAKNDYNVPGAFKSVAPTSRRIPSHFTISTDDPILPIEAFFPNLKERVDRDGDGEEEK